MIRMLSEADHSGYLDDLINAFQRQEADKRESTAQALRKNVKGMLDNMLESGYTDLHQQYLDKLKKLGFKFDE